jgi:hypothetical protein
MDSDGSTSTGEFIAKLRRSNSATAGPALRSARPARPVHVTVVPSQVKAKARPGEQHPPGPASRPRAVRGGVQERGCLSHAEGRPPGPCVAHPVRENPAARLARATFPRTQPCTGPRCRMDRPTSAAPVSTSPAVARRNPAGATWGGARHRHPRGDRRRVCIPAGAPAARGAAASYSATRSGQ